MLDKPCRDSHIPILIPPTNPNFLNQFNNKLWQLDTCAINPEIDDSFCSMAQYHLLKEINATQATVSPQYSQESLHC